MVMLVAFVILSVILFTYRNPEFSAFHLDSLLLTLCYTKCHVMGKQKLVTIMAGNHLLRESSCAYKFFINSHQREDKPCCQAFQAPASVSRVIPVLLPLPGLN
ncbi:hypothetical protein XELAEV_18008279mg [Xenopus laevis]|uniref:Secreted protein n=1 Tax=Xenopus laevis TaxID=8355 RepID=A0A974I5G6_XENLA|nr:hypothetical protein XELAEV_18008279mg [Xenopus laevis]